MSDPGDYGADASFHQRTRDPHGNQYLVQVTPVSGITGPVFLSKDGEPPGPLLRLVNSLLRRIQPTSSFDGASVEVYPDGAEDPVFLELQPTSKQALDVATSVVAEIEAGVFEPRHLG